MPDVPMHSCRSSDIKTLIVPPKASFSGGIFASGQYYNVRGIDNRRSPYSYNLAGNLTFKLSVITVPLSFSFRDQQFSYGHSFNKFGMILITNGSRYILDTDLCVFRIIHLEEKTFSEEVWN